MVVIEIVTVILLIRQWLKHKAFEAATRGLLYYVETHYGESMTTEKVKELQKQATDQMLKEFFHKN